MTEADTTLSDSEVADYRREGYVVPKFRLPANKLANLQSLTERLIAENRHLGDEPMASPHIPGSGVQSLKSDPAWIEIPTYTPILDMVEQLIGPDIVLWGTTLFHKPAKVGRIVPWHRDGRYWPISPLATTSVWIAVSDCGIGNGCLRVIPGSHANRETGQHFRDHSDAVAIPETLRAEEYDESTARDIVLEAGQMVIFGVYSATGPTRMRAAHRASAMLCVICPRPATTTTTICRSRIRPGRRTIRAPSFRSAASTEAVAMTSQAATRARRRGALRNGHSALADPFVILSKQLSGMEGTRHEL